MDSKGVLKTRPIVNLQVLFREKDEELYPYSVSFQRKQANGRYGELLVSRTYPLKDRHLWMMGIVSEYGLKDIEDDLPLGVNKGEWYEWKFLKHYPEEEWRKEDVSKD